MTDTKKPEHQQKTTQPTPPPKGDEIVNNTSAPLTTEQQKTGNPINLLTLLIAIAGAALGGYSLNQNYAAHSEISNLQITTKQQQQTITELKDQLVTADIDRQKLPDMINQAISLALPTEQLSHEDVQNLVTEQLSKQPKALDQATVQSLINQSLDSLAQGETKIDLSEEIAAVQKSEANARAALKEIEEKSKNIDQNLEEKRLLIEHALAQSSNSINPYPLINALKMAQIAAQDGNYQAAQAYLGQASNTFTLFNLNQSNYAQYQEALIKLRTEYSVLAAQAAPTTKIDNIIKSLASWPYKNTNPLNLLSPQKENKPADWKARLKGVGQNILEKTVTVTKIDDAGLTWIKTNETLQTILKENLRLDLAYARNALQLHDYTTYSATADQLRSQIERLFDTENTDVATALTTLENLKDSGEQIPDINGLISKIEQTAKE